MARHTSAIRPKHNRVQDARVEKHGEKDRARARYARKVAKTEK